MTRTYLSVTVAASMALVLAGCANKNNDQTQNPDEVTDGQTAGGEGEGAEGDGPAKSSRARGSTSTRGSAKGPKARTVTAKKPPRGPVDEGGGGEEGPNGLLAEVYDLDTVAEIPDFSTLADPNSTFEVPNLDYDEVDFTEGFAGAGAKEHYAIKFTGSINITAEAEYELCLHSDDGSQLLLEDTLLVDNDGIHDEPVEACELVYLAPGEYQLQVNYIQGSGPLLAMHFAWAQDGGEKVIVPTEVLFKPATDPAGG